MFLPALCNLVRQGLEYCIMLNKFIITLLVVFFITYAGPAVSLAGEDSPPCARLDGKASGDMLKYSLDGEANGPIFFSGISCAIEHRNRELCAMEMISFDTTSKVYDFYSAEKIEIGKAYFWLDEKDKAAPVLAFSSKEAAEKYGAENEGGVVLDYTALTERKFK